MLSALLPGVREFRTPLVAGVLWTACLWLLFGESVVDSEATQDFADRFADLRVPDTVWLGGAALLIYLIGGLLVVRESPFAWFSQRYRQRIYYYLVRLDQAGREPETEPEYQPKPPNARLLRLWHSPRIRFNRNLVRAWASRDLQEGPDWGSSDSIDAFLHNEYRILETAGQLPVMQTSMGGCTAPIGFHGLYDAKTVPAQMHESNYLGQVFVDEIKRERPAVETRIQMQFPEVYAEIDRWKVEGELRLTVFWPLILLSILLAFVWTPLAIVLLALPFFLVRDGFGRLRQASEKTWGAFTAGEVSSPIYDALKSAKAEGPRDFPRSAR